MTLDEQLDTPRLRLRRWRPEDEAAMAEINDDPQVTRYLNRPIGPAATAEFYGRVCAHWAQYGYGFWAVDARLVDLRGFIGFVGVAHPTFLPGLAARPELGWRLARRAWGRGLAGEAAVAARDHAFGALGLAELISIIHPGNERSRRLARSLGMTVEGAVYSPVLARDVELWGLAAPGG